MTYDALGRRASLTYPNGITTNYQYDQTSNLVDINHLNPLNQIFESVNYVYDLNGNRTKMQRANVPVKLPAPKSNITFNSANQMLTFDDKSMTYDENGNMASITNSCGTTTFRWDARNQLVAINGYASALTSSLTCETLSASFKYDALGRRIEKTIDGRVIEYFYDGSDIVQEIEGGVVTASYLRTLYIDEPLARLTPNSSRFYQSDALGSVIGLTDETGVMRTQYTYDPFGNITVSGEVSDNPFQYTGRENDRTGLYYYRARYYSPELRRFISEDPLGIIGGLSYYVYTGNNPIFFIDPFGLFDPQAAARYLNNPANGWTGTTSQGRCAAAVRRAINAGGVATPNNPAPAVDYMNYLPSIGFQQVNLNGYQPQVGDIAVFPSITSNPSGHIEMYTGNRWQSDYIQPGTTNDGSYGTGFFANRGWVSQPFRIYRGGSR
jgi:RHS repeat-associated protein